MKLLRLIAALALIALIMVTAATVGLLFGAMILMVRPAGLILSFIFVVILRTRHWIFMKHMQFLKVIEKIYPFFP